METPQRAGQLTRTRHSYNPPVAVETPWQKVLHAFDASYPSEASCALLSLCPVGVRSYAGYHCPPL